MIRIDQYLLTGLEEGFLAQVKLRGDDPTTPLERLEKGRKKFKGLQKQILDYCISEFDNIIKATPDKLESIIQHFHGQGWDAAMNYLIKPSSTRKFKDTLFDYFGYKSFRSDLIKGVWYADKLNIKTCPYCNSQFTLTTRENGSAKKARFQFDHFFAKTDYPYLSISMYNLIPACADCNLSKSSNPTNLNDNYHPYYSSLADKCEFSLDNKSVLEKLILKDVDQKLIKIKLESISSSHTTLINNHKRAFHLDDIYENHKDFAEEILMKAIMYPETKRQELFKIKGLFKDESTFYRYLLGNYHLEGDILKRPLAKFTQDIAKQLGLIEKK
ncbi:MAG: hypothetical protein O9340_08015 [Cyclobacteriaceae bacterium]|nr:hypothetical protein [Cyclobacteriaceae bacterium]